MTEATERRETRHVRVYAEMVDQLAWLVEFEGGTSAAILEQIAGKALARRYERVRERAEAIKAIKAGQFDLGGEG